MHRPEQPTQLSHARFCLPSPHHHQKQIPSWGLFFSLPLTHSLSLHSTLYSTQQLPTYTIASSCLSSLASLTLLDGQGGGPSARMKLYHRSSQTHRDHHFHVIPSSSSSSSSRSSPPRIPFVQDRLQRLRELASVPQPPPRLHAQE